MEEKHEIYDQCKREIYRIGWRVQYKAKKIRNREFPFYDGDPSSNNFANIQDDKIWISQMINMLPPLGKLIIDQIYLQGFTEAEVAKKLNISQQAVNKWKRKMIQKLFQTSNL